MLTIIKHTVGLNERLIQYIKMPSSSTRDLLPPSYVTKERGKIQVKGKGEMTTFWVESKANRAPPSKDDVRSQGFTF